MKAKLFVFLMILIMSASVSAKIDEYGNYTEDTFMEEIIGLFRPLLIVCGPFIIVMVISGIIVGGAKTVSKGAQLTSDLFKDDEEEDDDDYDEEDDDDNEEEDDD